MARQKVEETTRRALLIADLRAEVLNAGLPSVLPDNASFDMLVKDLRRVLAIYRDQGGPVEPPTVETDTVSSPVKGGAA